MKTNWYNNGTEEKLISNDGIIPIGFNKGRLKKYSKLDYLIEHYPKEMIYDLYIIQNLSFNKLFEKLNISRDDLRRLIQKYKIHKNPKLSRKNNTYIRPKDVIDNVAKKSSLTQKRRWENLSIEDKENWSNKQKKAHSTIKFKTKISEINKEYRKNLKLQDPLKDNELNKRRKESCKRIWKEDLTIRDRRHETEIQNRLNQKNKLCRTISEQKLYDKLITIYPDLRYDIKVDERYPYFCDFYIPSSDIFIELQAHPSHGRLPIDYLNIEEYSKYPNKWVDVFARRDVEKFNIALTNKINLIRIYPSATLEENFNINKNLNTKLIEICYRSQFVK